MNCQEVKESLPALIDDELPPAERAEVEKHLEGCEECSAEKHRQEQFTTRVKTSLEDLRPSEMFVKGVLDRLESPATRKKEDEVAARRTKVSLTAAGAVVLLVVVAAVLVSLLGSPGERDVAKVTGYAKAWLLSKSPGGEDKKDKLPLHLPADARIETEPGGKVIMNLAAGGSIELFEKSRIDFAGATDGGVPTLNSGGLKLQAKAGVPAKMKAGAVEITADDGATVQVSLQYGKTVTVHLIKGSASITCGRKTRRPEVGEIWLAPADASSPATRKPGKNDGKNR